MKKKGSIVAGVVVLLVALATAALADKPVKLIVNGYEIKPDIPPQVINGRTMVPIRWAAEALGAEVQWDEQANAVRINKSQGPTPMPLSKEQIETIIEAQGKHKDSYYIDGLSYDVANLDDDDDWELVAKIDGTVHLGSFFIFDKDSSGHYKLVAEQDWKVEHWYFGDPIKIEDKKLFNLVTRTGGTGVDVFIDHLWYVEQGEFKEAWQGTIKERSMMAGPENFYMKIGGYQVDAEGKRLYVWETTHRLDQDGVSPQGDLNSSTKVYVFNGTSFIRQESKKADPDTGKSQNLSNTDYYNYVDARIEKMMSNPDAMLFSLSDKYIEMSKNEYTDIYKLGEKALPALEKIMNEEESKGISGLRYVLARQIKTSIKQQSNFFDR